MLPVFKLPSVPRSTNEPSASRSLGRDRKADSSTFTSCSSTWATSLCIYNPPKRRKIPEVRHQRAKERRQARRRPLIFVRVCPGFSRHEDRLVNVKPNLHSCWANRGPDTFHWHPHLSQMSREAHEKEEKVMASILGLSIGHKIGRSAALLSSSEEVWIE